MTRRHGLATTSGRSRPPSSLDYYYHVVCTCAMRTCHTGPEPLAANSGGSAQHVCCLVHGSGCPSGPPTSTSRLHPSRWQPHGGADWWTGGFCFPSSSFPKGQPPGAGAQPAPVCPGDPRGKGNRQSWRRRLVVRPLDGGGQQGERSGSRVGAWEKWWAGSRRVAYWAGHFWGSKRSSPIEAEALRFSWVVPLSIWGLGTP